jgi:hypothetical protein
MSYPSFPVAGNVPWALWTEDIAHMNTAGGGPAAIVGLGAPGLSGGLVVVDPSTAPAIFSPLKAMTSWTFNIVPPGQSGTTRPTGFPQRIGLIYNFVCTNGPANGEPFLT